MSHYLNRKISISEPKKSLRKLEHYLLGMERASKLFKKLSEGTFLSAEEKQHKKQVDDSKLEDSGPLTSLRAITNSTKVEKVTTLDGDTPEPSPTNPEAALHNRRSEAIQIAPKIEEKQGLVSYYWENSTLFKIASILTCGLLPLFFGLFDWCFGSTE